MTKYLREGQVTDEYDRPVPGSTVYVFNGDNDAQLWADEAGTIPLTVGAPILTDAFGNYSYYGNAAIYREDTHFSGKLRYKEVVPIGLDGLYPPADGRPGQFFAFDADNNPVAASGTGADDGLRTDLAANSGSLLIKHKPAAQSGVTTYGRSAGQLKKLGADDSDGLSLIHFIDPAHDDDILAGTNATALDSYLANVGTELAAVQASSGRTQRLLIPAFKYLQTGTWNLNVPDLIIDGHGASLTSPLTSSSAVLALAGANNKVRGLRVYLSDITSAGWTVNVTGTDCKLEDCTLEAIEGSGGILAFVRQGADGFRFIGSTLRGGLGIQQEGSDFKYIGGNFYSRGTAFGTDDAIAVKANGRSTVNGEVLGCTFYDFYAMLSIGTQVGTTGANDPNHSIICGNIGGVGNIGYRCVTQLYIKPCDGATDRRDGGVIGIGWSGNELYDPYGERFRSGVILVASRGAYIKSVHGKGNIVVARGVVGDVTSTRSGAHDIRIDNLGPAGSAPSTINDVDVQIDYRDPFQGYANGTVITALGTAGPDPYGSYGVGAAVPGQPVQNISSVTLSDTAYGSMSDIVIDVSGDGCDASGMSFTAGLDDAIFVRRARLTNICRTGSASTRAGIVSSSRFTIGTDVSFSQVVGHPYRLLGTGDVICPELAHQFSIGSIAAAGDVTLAPLQTQRGAELIELRLTTTNALAQDATNNVVMAFSNMDGGGASFGSWGNNTAGAGADSKRTALVANGYVTAWLLRDITSDTEKTQATFARDARLQVAITHNGTGAPLTNARMVARFAPC